MQKKTLMKKWGTGVLTGVLVLGSLTPVFQPYKPVSAAENTLKQLQASGQGSVSDVMFEDLNGNGTQDAGESKGIAGIKVELHNDQGTLVGTATTGADGRYSFTDLPDGTYYLHVDMSTLPTDEKLYTTQGINGSDGNSTYFTITNGNAVTGFHFGFYPNEAPKLGSVSDVMFEDLNGNTSQDSGEKGVAGIKVELRNTQGELIASTTTGADGRYTFSDVSDGQYYIHVDLTTIPKNEKLYTTEGINGADGNSSYFTVSNGNAITGFHFGFYPQQGAIQSYVYNDANGNGQKDGGEAGISGVHIALYDEAGAKVADATTDSAGAYHFDALDPGRYYAKADIPADYKYQSSTYFGTDGTTGYFSVASQQTIHNELNLGLHTLDNSAVSGKVTDAATGAGLANTRVELHDVQGNLVDAQQTDANGNYNFTNVSEGNYYTKVIIPSGYEYASSNGYGNDGNSNYIQLNGENTATGYSIALKKQVTNNSAISGKVTDAATGAGLPNTRVELHDVQGNTVDAQQTDASGNYNFTGLAAGDYYTKVVIPSNYDYASSNGYGSDGNSNYIQLDGQNTSSSYTIALRKQANTTISGVINTPSGQGVNENVSLYDVDGTLVKTVTTNSQGQFSFDGVGAGNYYVKASIPEGYTFESSAGFGSDGNSFYLQADGTSDISNLRLTLAQKVGQIRSTVFNDLNKNGTQEVGESGVAGATVTLYSNTGAVVETTTTDANGLYKFETITPGTYYVKVTPPAGYDNLANAAFGDDGVSGYIQVESEQVRTDMNAALVSVKEPSTIATVKWNYNKDGISRPVNNNGILEIPNTYLNEFNTPHVDLQFYNSDNVLVKPTGYTVSFSDPTIAAVDFSNPDLIALVHNEKAGSTNVTIRDAAGNVVRSFTFTVTAPTDVPATDLTLGASNITANVNDTGKIDATVSPSNATNKTLSYTPADPSVITVDANGNWTAHKAGTTTIAVKTTDGSNITKTVNVTVTDPNAIASVKWNYNKDGVSRPVNNNGILEIPNTYLNQFNKPNVDIQFYNSSNVLVKPTGYTVSFSDTTIAAADFSNPDLIALVHNEKAGSTNVTIRDAAGNVVRSFTYTVTATDILATDLALGASNITANVNDTGKIDATVSPSNATNKTLSYTPADSSIITVDANGNWTAHKSGTTTIAVKTTDGSNITKTINVTVNKSIAERVGSVDFEFVLGRNALSSTKAYVYPHVADVPAGVTYRVITHTDDPVDSNILVGTSDGTYHQEIESQLSLGSWDGQPNGVKVELIATYQGIDYVVKDGYSIDYVKPHYSKHVYTD
ncbi:hypothetical protein HB904_07950 [Listeria booriae]|uniref:BIG2 domain-containing protein n=1 Tax=Listeria booriae TaxID=1552123 RepID=A0A841YRA8_9LIST|nr:SdrD B-like domain-containing protein [Listeria booriae]MBC1402916.1 hypothetical protein [Listeria booriae]MBC1616115.1 hypothetical protein [Listeria booriae]